MGYIGRHVAICSSGRDNCSGTENLTFGPDPYMKDVWDDDTPVWLCEYCSEEHAMDI